jgi:hypothetical protein
MGLWLIVAEMLGRVRCWFGAPVRDDDGNDYVPYLNVWDDGRSNADRNWVENVNEGRAGSVRDEGEILFADGREGFAPAAEHAAGF